MNKKVLLALCPLLALSLPTFAGSGDNPFDVSQATYNSGLHLQSFTNDIIKTADGRMAAVISSIPGNSQLLSMFTGMARFAEENDDWFEAMEYQATVGEAIDNNADRTDNVAWAVIRYSEITVVVPEKDGVAGYSKKYRHEDLISGSDWDNNGKIDVIEDWGRYRGVELTM